MLLINQSCSKHLLEILTIEVVFATKEVLHYLPLLLVLLVTVYLVVVHIGVFHPLLRLVLGEVPLLIIELLGDEFGVVLKAVTRSIDSLIDVCLRNCERSFLAHVTLIFGADHPTFSFVTCWEKPFSVCVYNL